MTTDAVPAILLVALISYLLGSLNFAIIVSRLLAGDDVRKHGSGNAGMTNMLRTYGKGPAIATALGDFLKAFAAVWIGRWIFGRMGVSLVIDGGYLSGLFVLLGHLFPLYFRFKGGKGVMTSLGVIFVVDPLIFLIIAVLFVPVVFVSRIVSLASVLGAIGFPVITLVLHLIRGQNPLYDTICAVIIGGIVLFMHRANIARLLSGTENRFGQDKKKTKNS